MKKLDDLEEFEKFDKGKILASIRMLPDQMEQAWEEVRKLDIPKEYTMSSNVVVCGMGGSALGGRIVDSLLESRVRVPIEISTDYNIPYYVNKETLVISTSYSGNTEETISATEQAIEKNANVFGVSTGGELEKILTKNNQISYIFDPIANPSAQPRMGLGYSISSTLAILSKCGLFHLSNDDFYELVVTIRNYIKNFDIDIPYDKNIAKLLAGKLFGKIPVLISSSHLIGVTHAMKNQLNENSKLFSVLFDLPEMNHHLLEGLKNPKNASSLLSFLFFHSDKYSERVKKRLELTMEVVEKNRYEANLYKVTSDTKISEIFEVLSLGSFLSFYLSFMHGVDPSEIPWVDYFKKELAKT